MEQNCGKKTLLLLLHSPPRVQQSFRPPPRNPKSQTGFTYPFFCLPYSRRPKKAYQTMLCPSFFLYLIDSPPLLPENEQTTLKNAKIVALSRFHVWRYPFFRRKKSLSFEDKKVTRISWRPLLLKLQRIETTSMRQKAIQRTHFVPPPLPPVRKTATLKPRPSTKDGKGGGIQCRKNASHQSPQANMELTNDFLKKMTRHV